MTEHTEPNEVLVTKITNVASGIFPSFGGGNVSPDNPVSHALKNAPAMFAAGVDISAVVRLTLIMSGQPDLLDALVMAKNLINANTLLDAGNPANIKIEAAIEKAEV